MGPNLTELLRALGASVTPLHLAHGKHTLRKLLSYLQRYFVEKGLLQHDIEKINYF